MSKAIGRKLTDSEAADILISTSTSVYSDPGIAWRNLQDVKFALEQAKSRAEGMAGRAFDSDRITTKSSSDFVDYVNHIMSLKKAVAAAETAYFCAMASFRYCLERAKEIGAFDGFQAAVWKAYYEHGSDAVSMQQLADRFNVTKSRIQYLITSTRAKAAFCRAIDSVLSDMDFSFDPDNGVCVVMTGNDQVELVSPMYELGDNGSDEDTSETEMDNYDGLVLPDFTKI